MQNHRGMQPCQDSGATKPNRGLGGNSPSLSIHYFHSLYFLITAAPEPRPLHTPEHLGKLLRYSSASTFSNPAFTGRNFVSPDFSTLNVKMSNSIAGDDQSYPDRSEPGTDISETDLSVGSAPEYESVAAIVHFRRHRSVCFKYGSYVQWWPLRSFWLEREGGRYRLER